LEAVTAGTAETTRNVVAALGTVVLVCLAFINIYKVNVILNFIIDDCKDFMVVNTVISVHTYVLLETAEPWLNQK
jgi:hypothetical protein